MKRIIETLREMIAFSEKQRAAEMRRLKAAGKKQNSAKVDAYAAIIDQLSSILHGKDGEQKNETQDNP